MKGKQPTEGGRNRVIQTGQAKQGEGQQLFEGGGSQAGEQKNKKSQKGKREEKKAKKRIHQ